MTRIERLSAAEDRGYSTPCRIWQGTVRRNGYGQITLGSRAEGTRRMGLVHRVVYELMVGPIPDGYEIDHLCRQRDCCEVTHLDAVTPKENSLRGSSPDATRARAAAVTHCPRGHEYTPVNTRWVMSGAYRTRRCRECGRTSAHVEVSA